MKKNLYYKHVFARKWALTANFSVVLLAIFSYARTVIEVFTRRNFGERYFSTATAIIVFVVMLILPSYMDSPIFSLNRGYGGYERSSWTGFITWYIYLAAFAVAAFLRRREIKRGPSVYDFEKFSLYNGDVLPFFQNLLVFGKGNQIRKIEMLYEPGIFFICGILLWIIGQKLGIVLVFCSIFYSLSYAIAYKIGKDFVLDRIDEMIMNDEMYDAFVLGEPADKTRGIQFSVDKPQTKEKREKLVNTFFEGEDEESDVE